MALLCFVTIGLIRYPTVVAVIGPEERHEFTDNPLDYRLWQLHGQLLLGDRSVSTALNRGCSSLPDSGHKNPQKKVDLVITIVILSSQCGWKAWEKDGMGGKFIDDYGPAQYCEPVWGC